jgi:hypothetical protein
LPEIVLLLLLFSSSPLLPETIVLPRLKVFASLNHILRYSIMLRGNHFLCITKYSLAFSRRAYVGRNTLDRDDDTIQPTTPVFLRFGAGKQAQFFTVVLDPRGFGAFSEISSV